MKKIALGLFALTLLAGGIQAQEKKAKSGKEGKPAFDKTQKGLRKDGGLKALNLTTEQQKRVDEINKGHMAAIKDLKSKENVLTVTQYKDKMQTIRKDRQEKIEKVLTPDQKEKWAKMKADRKGKGRSTAHFNDRKPARGIEGRKKMEESLGLSQEQAAKVKLIREETQKKVSAIRENTTLSQDQKRQQTMTAFKQQHEEVKSLLTPEQVKKMEAMPKPGRRPIAK